MTALLMAYLDQLYANERLAICFLLLAKAEQLPKSDSEKVQLFTAAKHLLGTETAARFRLSRRASILRPIDAA